MIDFRIQNHLYPVTLLRLRRFFERSQWFSLAQLVRYQDRRLAQIVGHAYRNVPYYRSLFERLGLTPADIRTVADLQQLPILTKETLRTEFDRLQAVNKARYLPEVTATSGTSGDPLTILLDKPARMLEFAYYWRHWSWAGYRLGMPFIQLTSQMFLNKPALAGRAYFAEPITRRLMLNTLWLGPERVPVFLEAIRRYRPRFVKGVASTLYYFAHFFRQAGVDDVRFQGAFSTGEVLLPPQRAVIEEVFRCKVYDSYGHTERTVAISECLAGGRHINPEYGIFEVVDAVSELSRHSGNGGSGKLVSGRVVGTGLHNFSMPLLRYEVGDLVDIDDPTPSCPCGRAMPLVRRISGRQADVIVTPAGHVSTTLFVVFEEVPGLLQGQVIQEAIDHLCVRVVASPAYTPTSEAKLVHAIRRFVGEEMRIELEYLTPEAMRAGTDGKLRAVISKIDRPPAALPRS